MEKEKAICGMWHITQNELRENPNMWFVLRNMAWAGPDMSVYIFCSDQNYDYIMDLLGDKAPHFNVIVAFKGDPPKEQAWQEFVNLYTNWKIWEMMETDYALLIQMDVYIRKRLDDCLFNYDWYACRWAWKIDEPGGGISICRVAKMVSILKEHRPNTEIDCPISSDEFINRIIQVNGTYPPLMENVQNLMESMQRFTEGTYRVLIVDPYAVHQPWTFSYPFSQEEFRLFWRELLTIRI